MSWHNNTTLVRLPSKGDNLTEVTSWLRQNVGKGSWLLRVESDHVWKAVYLPSRHCIEVLFRDASRAVMFKLVWHGDA